MTKDKKSSKTAIFNIQRANRRESGYIYRRIMEHNKKICRTPENEEWEENINLAVRDSSGLIIGGALCIRYLKTVFIDVLWVREECRHLGIGSALLKEIERIAAENGCRMVHVNTLNIQAPGFYIKNGFEAFAELDVDGCQDGIKSIFLKKRINGG